MSNQISTIQSFSFNDIQVSFSQDAFLNATEIAKQFGKRVQHYLNNERTQEYIVALTEAVFTASTSQSDGNKILSKQKQLVIIKKGGKAQEQGTWLHPKLAIDFARWLNPKFAVWCDMQIEKILKGEYAQPSSTQNHQLYDLISTSIDKHMDYARQLHHLNAIAPNPILENQFKWVREHIHAMISYCYQHNLTTPTGKA